MLADRATIEIHEGRWMTPDPMGGDITNPQSLNRYAGACPERSRRVLNNPATLNDPLGLEGFNPADQCNDPAYAESHAECEAPGDYLCFYYGLCDGYYDGPYGGGGGGGGGGPITPPAGQPPLAGGPASANANRWVSPTLTPPESYCSKYGIPSLGGLGDSSMPCFAILVTSSATFGGYVPNAPGPGPRIESAGIVPTKSYWDYLGCVATVLPAKAIGNADTAWVTLALHLAPRANPYLWPVAAVYDLNIELQTQRECSREVYGSH